MEAEVYDNLNLQDNCLVRSCLSKFGAEKEYVKFSGYVVKFYGPFSVNKFLQWLRMGTRVLLITNAALYNLKGDNFDCHRRLPLSKISSIIRCYLRQQFIIKVKREKARSYLSEEVSVICDSIRFAQAVKCHAACPITYKKKKELNNFVLRMAKHTLNRINAKEDKTRKKIVIDNVDGVSERVETMDADSVIAEYLRRVQGPSEANGVGVSRSKLLH
ncbi:uncharacterized protein [Physcomitrium patens]|uniref:Uncharacterized protein n=1 Tax=Physcomitrium patens TaxID=3218 RepID=A0A7I4AE29_PHYPA|nr:uncharacterized protein LOC112288431 isoform X1 [Physcomitrium patens]|eukprot:XP_024388353.1 uncharacterized protein LOC112288431 isoform X1 [Physcomitrella patens]